MTRWWSFVPASWLEGRENPPMSQNDSLAVVRPALWGETQPTCHNDSLVVKKRDMGLETRLEPLT